MLRHFTMSFVLLSLTAAAQDSIVLWEMGVPDGHTADFALGPASHQDYDEDGFYVVGVSEAARDWPYVHPGPGDAWAGSRAHSFTIVFALESAPAEGKCRLLIDLADTHASAPPELKIDINGRLSRRSLRPGAGDASIMGDPAQGKAQQVKVSFPASLLRAGDNEITLSNDQGSWILYDHLALEAPPSVRLAAAQRAPIWFGEVSATPQVLAGDGPPMQVVRVPVRCFVDSIDVSISVSDADPFAARLAKGFQMLEVPAPAVEQAQTAPVTFTVDGEALPPREVLLQPVRPWTVYLLHHTHLDIGYTHLQPDVERLQWEHLDKALELAEATRDYPPEAQFKWLPEGLWAVDGYLKTQPPEKQAALIEAVRRGDIVLDALYGNELTALCRPEELVELTGYARRLATQHGLTIDSAMITDVPGYTWGLVPVLAQSGVRYLSIGPNSGHRIGHTLSTWGDKPFYWVSPSGQERVLCWVHGRGYSWFHTGLNWEAIKKRLDGDRIMGYLGELEAADYPYDVIVVRYNIGSDNGPPDPQLADMVRDWNARYAYPKFVIASTSEAFSDFEGRYAEEIPEQRGDFTPYWEDGAASSALETGVNRRAAERLVQANALWAMLRPEDYPATDFHAAWREVLLYDEHTWGAYNSISDPESEFALGQWAVKQAFALDAETASKRLVDSALEAYRVPAEEAESILVFNTCAWRRRDLVVLPADWNLAGKTVTTDDGCAVPSQTLADGALAFLTMHVPAFGAERYQITEDTQTGYADPAVASERGLTNGILSLEIDPETGAIASLRHAEIEGNLVDSAQGMGLNEYLYVAGRSPGTLARAEGTCIEVVDAGPLVASIRVTSVGEGCRAIQREIRLIAGLDRVEIRNVLDKEKVYEQEGVHLAFPFNVPEGELRMDIPFASVRAEADLLPGACRNYFTVQRWVDVSNEAYGVTWTTAEAPLIEIGAVTADPIRVGWLETTREPQTTFYSYVMNNYWETNYKAEQHGPTPFTYCLRPHAAFDEAATHRFAVERSQPLIAIPAAKDCALPEPPLRIAGDGILVTNLKPADSGKGLVLRLLNPTSQNQTALIQPAWSGIAQSDFFERNGTPTGEEMILVPWEIATLRLGAAS